MSRSSNFWGSKLAKHGGNQGGRPKGTNGLEKEALRARLRAMVAAAIDPMTEAQIANARGIKYLVARDRKTGKFRRLSEDALGALEDGTDEREIVEVWEKDPNVSAFTDLLNRTLDKPTETVHQTITGDAELLARLDAWKQRNAKDKK